MMFQRYHLHQHFWEFLSGVGTAGKMFHISSSLVFRFKERKKLLEEAFGLLLRGLLQTICRNRAFNFYFEGNGIKVPGKLEGKLGPCKHSLNQVLEFQWNAPLGTVEDCSWGQASGALEFGLPQALFSNTQGPLHKEASMARIADERQKVGL